MLTTAPVRVPEPIPLPGIYLLSSFPDAKEKGPAFRRVFIFVVCHVTKALFFRKDLDLSCLYIQSIAPRRSDHAVIAQNIATRPGREFVACAKIEVVLEQSS